MVKFEVMAMPGELSGPGQMVEICGSEARHLSRVLRVRPGEAARLKDGFGRAFHATVVSISQGRVLFRLDSELHCPVDTIPICLMPAVIKGKRMDWLIQKACELGVRRIQPVLSRRTVANTAGSGQRVRRWRDIARQALKQSRGNWLTTVEEPLKLQEAVERLESEHRILPLETGLGHHMLDTLTGMEVRTEVAILTGPEGGFSKEEAEFCLHEGFEPVTLGRRILRAETAALAAAVIAVAVFQKEMALQTGREGITP